MDEKLKFASVILELLNEYGLPAVLSIIKAWDIEDPTLEDLEELRNAVPEGESYFEDSPEDD
jgi:hypothetical protein